MSLPPASPSGPASTLPPRADTARICLFVSAPLSFLTFLASSQLASSTGSRLGLLAAAALAPLILVFAGVRVVTDHDPSPVRPDRGRWVKGTSAGTVLGMASGLGAFASSGQFDAWVRFLVAGTAFVALFLVGFVASRGYAHLRRSAHRDLQSPVQWGDNRPPGRWDWTDILAFGPVSSAALLFFGSLLIVFTRAVDGGLPAQGRSAVESFANQTSAYMAALASLFILLWLRRGLRMPDIGWRLPRPLGRVGWLPWIVIAVLAAAGAYYLALWLGSLSAQALPNSPNTQCTTVRDQFGGYVAVAIVLVCLIVPFSEETIFRGFLYGWLRRRLQVIPAVVVSAAIFSAAHVVLVLALPLFAVGVVLALLYEYSSSLIPGAIVHGLFNLVGIVMILGATNSC